ncbi:hypothetical protein ABPG72_008178 [Tetrahymena utriculariae]
MGNKIPEKRKQKCQQYGQNEKDILGLIDPLNNKGYQCLDKKMVVKHDMREISQQLLYKISNVLLNLEFGNIPKLIQIYQIMKIEQYQLLIQDMQFQIDYYSFFKESSSQPIKDI